MHRVCAVVGFVQFVLPPDIMNVSVCVWVRLCVSSVRPSGPPEAERF